MHQSHSSITTYQTCPRKYYYDKHTSATPQRYGNRLGMGIGNAVHQALEAALYDRNNDPTEVALASLRNNVSRHAPEYPTAYDMLEAYVPMLGIHDWLHPYYHNGEPMIEHYFRMKLPNGQKFSGVIDAVVTGANNRVLLIDWKCRGRFASESEIALDSQLHMYAYVAKHIMGLPIDRVLQVQLLSKPPAKPTLTKTGKLSKQMGKTTWAVFDKAVRDRGLNSSDYAQDFKSKFADDNHFIQFSRINMRNVDDHLQATMATMEKMENDEDFLPIYRSYTCGNCGFRDLCLDGLGPKESQEF